MAQQLTMSFNTRGQERMGTLLNQVSRSIEAFIYTYTMSGQQTEAHTPANQQIQQGRSISVIYTSQQLHIP